MTTLEKTEFNGLSKRLLSAAGSLYGHITSMRNSGYDRGWLKTRWLKAPVIAVGNMTTGGTGKTPTVIYLAKMIESLGCRPGVIMRGYGEKAGKPSDEAMLLRRHLPGVPIITNPDRIDGGGRAIAQGAEVILADDAYQHRRLGRDFNICMVDAISPFGGGLMLPTGRLREPMIGFRRADLVIITRCDQVDESRLTEIETEIHRWTADLPVLRSLHHASRYEDLSGREYNVEMLKWKKVFAWAGIGRPEAFFETLRRLGAELVGTAAFRDHYRVSAEDLRNLRTQAERAGAELMICTEKDIVKINEPLFGAAGIASEKMAALKIEIVLPADHEKSLRERVEQVLREFSAKKLASVK